MNERIRSPEIRVIFGEHNVVLPTWKALNKAKELGLDLVEVAPNARPPVCRIVDYGKYKYEQSKQKKSDKPKVREKEVKFRVNIEEHDYSIKMMNAEKFLSHGFKIRVQLQFRGRQMAHKDIGFKLMERVKEDLAGMAHVDLGPKLNNRNILMMLSPLPPEKQKRKFLVGDIDEDELDDLDDLEDDSDLDADDYDEESDADVDAEAGEEESDESDEAAAEPVK